MTADKVYVLVAVDKRALKDGFGLLNTLPEAIVRSWVGFYLFDDQFAVANVTDLLTEPYAELSPGAAKLLVGRLS